MEGTQREELALTGQRDIPRHDTVLCNEKSGGQGENEEICGYGTHLPKQLLRVLRPCFLENG